MWPWNFFHVEVNHRRDIERQQLREHQSSDHCQTERLACIGAFAISESDRQRPEQRRHRGHHDGAEAQQAAAIDGVARMHLVGTPGPRAKSIIMIAFFFTTPNNMMSPTKP